MLSCFSPVWLFVTPWTVAYQAPLSVGFSRQEYWSGLPCPPPEDLPNPGIEPMSLMSPALAGWFFPTGTTWDFPFFSFKRDMYQKFCCVFPLFLDVGSRMVSDLSVCSSCLDCSPPGSSAHGILQARILEWVAISSSRGSSWPRDRTWVSRVYQR